VYNDKQAISLFLNWFRQLAVRGYIPPNDFAQIEQEYRTKEEVTSMLIKALEREREAIRQQAIEATQKEMAGMLSATLESRNRQIVLAMAEKGFALRLIAEVTQLSLEEVERLLTEEPSPHR
jgi:DNA-directed RNA polymerase specialized sigma24 family protein